MPKRKSTYKQYLFDPNVSIPRSTKYHLKKLKDVNQIEINKKISNSEENDLRIENENILNVSCSTQSDQIELDKVKKVNYVVEDDSGGSHLNNRNDLPNSNDEFAYNNEDAEHVSETHSSFNNDDDYESALSDDDDENDFIVSNIFNQEIDLKEMAAAFLAAFYNGKTTQKSLSDFIKLHNIHSSCKLPCNFDGLAKVLIGKNSKLNYVKTWFCNICLRSFEKLNNRFQRECHVCNSKLNMYYHLSITEQLNNIMKNIKLNDLNNIKKDVLFLNDIYDGQIYKEILNGEDGELFLRKEAFSFTINSDGISLCKKSKLTIWPIYLIINELTIEKRFSIENTIIAGLSIGNEKPNIETFYNPILIELKKLEIGTLLSIENLEKERKFFLIAGVFDKPARYAVLNMTSCNGFFGCTKCLQPGISHKANENAGIQHIYPFDINNPKGPTRTNDSYINDLKLVQETNQNINGIKGQCCLSYLKYFKPIKSTCIDYMHSLLEGVIKNFFKYWFSPEFSSSSYSIRRFYQEIDNRLALIFPPKFIPSTPRTIYSYNLWRAHEYLSFILYYSIPVFRDIMKFEYFENLKKLVVFMEILLSPSICLKELNYAQSLVTDFVQEVSVLYPKSIMLSGMHEMLHLIDCTIDFGPLNNSNCFQFEELNRKLVGFIHGYDLIGEELIKVFSTAQILSGFAQKVNNKELNEFISQRLIFKSSNNKKIKKNFQFKLVDKILCVNTSEILKIYEKFFNKKVDSIHVFHKLIVNGVYFSTTSVKTKRCDSCFINSKGQIGLIEFFIKHNDEIYVLAKKIVKMFNAFNSKKYKIDSKLFACYISDQYFVENIANIKKAVLINISQLNCFVSLFNCSHLFN